MKAQKSKLLSTTVIQLFLGATLATAGTIALADMVFAASSNLPSNPAATPKPAKSEVQMAACAPKKKCNPCAAKKACGACNPCGAKKACNPCGAKKACGACNPCGAKKACGACNPCGGASAAYSQKCMVPRLMKAALCNPCGAKKACNPCGAKKACNPCGAKKACNPCAAKKACNPCGAKKACNPCAAKKACNPCGAKKACNPCGAKKACNPCGAKKACNPCGAKKACNPCAAKKACNPCGAKKACGACNPCGGAAAPKLTSAEANSVYNCLRGELVAAYGKSGSADAANYAGWKSYASQPYVSDTHGGRFVTNYANAKGKSYGKYENAGRMPVGAKMAKDSFMVMPDGKVGTGPLFLMEKMAANFNKASDNWRYSMVMPNGKIFGVTNGANSAGMKFCYECHMAVAEDQDSLMLLPEAYRK